jgi:hypothetical protein
MVNAEIYPIPCAWANDGPSANGPVVRLEREAEVI